MAAITADFFLEGVEIMLLLFFVIAVLVGFSSLFFRRSAVEDGSDGEEDALSSSMDETGERPEMVVGLTLFLRCIIVIF